MLPKVIGKLFMVSYKWAKRIEAKVFSIMISGSFGKFGKKTVIVPPLRISGEKRIEIGNKVFIGNNSWLQVLPDGKNKSIAISIGDGTSIVGSCVISAVRRVILEDSVLLARNVYISDHTHKYLDTELPILSQGVYKIAPVIIKRGAWIGQNTIICPGVTIGVGSVIGANSVVIEDIPDYCVAVGAPARIVKRIKKL